MRLVIFDMDGTLIDSVAMVVETMTNAFNAVGEAVPSEDAIRSISGITARDAMPILAPGVPADRVESIIQSYSIHYRAVAGVTSEPLFEGTLEALDQLQADPGTTLAIATGKGLRSATLLLERHGIVDRFHSIQTPTDNRGKPDPQMIETAMAKAGATPDQTVMIGDTIHDMRMAKAAGVKAIGVTWGYHEAEALRAEGADVVLDRMDQLVSTIDKLLERSHA